LPCFVYGPERSLPDVRRGAWRTLRPDAGPGHPHPTAGAAAVGARPILIAYNLWLAEPDLARAREIAQALRSPVVRTLALPVGDAVQVSCNLIAPWAFGPEAAYDAVASRTAVARAELVGLAPAAVVERVPPHRRRELDLDPASTIEARLERAGLDGGRFAAHGDEG
jgi:glutamate formiminotransferase